MADDTTTDPMKEIENLFSQFRSDAAGIASGAVSNIAEALVLPLKLPMMGVKAIADAQPAGLPLPIPAEMKKALGISADDNGGLKLPFQLPKKEDFGWTGARPKIRAPQQDMTFLANEIGVH